MVVIDGGGMVVNGTGGDGNGDDSYSSGIR
jgi:hypothetical protein